jgi:hypothetical protein
MRLKFRRVLEKSGKEWDGVKVPGTVKRRERAPKVRRPGRVAEKAEASRADRCLSKGGFPKKGFIALLKSTLL